MATKTDKKQPPAASPPPAEGDAPRSRSKLVAQGLFLALAAGFVVSSTWQVQHQVFGAPLSSPETGSNCSFLLDQFEDAITRGLERAGGQRTTGKAQEAFEDVVSSKLSAIEKHCSSPTDRDAFATATRLRDAAEATIEQQQAVLAPLRTELHARRNP